MSWRFEVSATAARAFDRLDGEVARRVQERLAWFSEHFEEITHHPLSGDYKGSLKLRVGDWRIVYEIDNSRSIIFITGIEHRSRVYKKRR